MFNTIKQGEIYWANLRPTIGHEQTGIRPVLIVQNNILNDNLNTVIIAPITKNLATKGLMTTFFLTPKISGLKIDSVTLLAQIKCIDKQRLIKKAGELPSEEFRELRGKLTMVF